MKSEIRIIGFDDCPFDKFNDKEVKIIGTIFRGGKSLDGVVSTIIAIDGIDATEKLSSLIQTTKFRPQLQAILLDGITMGGFNVIDIHVLAKTTNLPVIVVMRNLPDFQKIKNALTKLEMNDRFALMEKAGIPIKHNNIYFQCAAISKDEAKAILSLTTIHADIPEPIRIAHLIAAGITKGESSGDA
ncbi:DUF99 family protein [Candidatus Woesearchaeota archaeon]|nr:MAG: hypothetical protein QS99_C0016G0013 [archaeon GW2011_AR4]MBS3130166.1 DUF99 family protein [Candidatus Woesearchaeota archaeon]HIH38997.1 DUF99 family protein [Candidatus Woesearchaeota archaeon]HIH48792.1 DUF99 family protein [Candidatus Woesearchaeota archaeon]HIJ04085.1 DUF99 family protein [Candidatus Woesearchaeota archaeon]